MTQLAAPAKLNLALLVGPTRPDGRHEVATVLQRISLADRIALESADQLRVDGFPEDTLVRRALESLAAAAGTEARWHVEIEKQIPVGEDRLHELAAELGADVPFFLSDGPQLAEGDGTMLQPLDLPQDYWVLVLLPHGERKSSTAAVYEAFAGEEGFAERRAALLRAVALGDLPALPPNDLASSPLADDLGELGALRADVSGAGPAVYGLFAEQGDTLAALAAVEGRAQSWIATPAW